jgi:succinyl-CoA synthetase beta subunit
LLKQYGIAVPQAVVATTAQEAAEAVDAFNGKAMLKGQVLTGGRGKAGAIRAVSSREQAESVASDILAMSVKGLAVKCLLVTEKLDIGAEYYAGLTIDRQAKAVTLIFSVSGGVEIEEIAASQPQKIRRLTMNGADGLAEGLSGLFVDRALLEQALTTVQNMYRLFREKDCSLVEINPLAVTVEGRLVAADAKIVFDDSALWRHPDVAILRNAEESSSEELEAEQAGLSFVKLSGEIGCMVNGAGLAMATMDGIRLAGGRAANFLDVGGSSNPRKVLDAMRILLRNQDIKVILINIFGGITRCDDIARGILMARERLNVPVPIVIRLIGTNEEAGREILQKAGMIVARSMTDAIRDAVRCAKEGAGS